MGRTFITRLLAGCLAAFASLAIPGAAHAQTFTNSTPITIPASGTVGRATPYPSAIIVSGIARRIGDVSVTLNGLSHEILQDVDILLVAPDGTRMVLMSDAGSPHVVDTTITLSDQAPTLVPSGPLTSTRYRPTNNDPGGAVDTFPAPAPASVPADAPAPDGTATFASKFGGRNANGTWSLYVADDLLGAAGSIAGGWSLTITQATPATEGQLMISEFRLQDRDEFIEIYNASGTAHVVSALSGTGYGIASSDGVTRCTIPNRTVIPAGGHYLCSSGPTFSLEGYPDACCDGVFLGDYPDDSGIALFNNDTGGASYSFANRIDAVGPATETNTLYKEGSGYFFGRGSSYFALVRRARGGCAGGIPLTCPAVQDYRTMRQMSLTAPLDTNSNAVDFVFVEPNGPTSLGAAGPQSTRSPLVRDGTPNLTMRKLDTCSGNEAGPNFSRSYTPDPAHHSRFGTIDIRRNVYNSTGTTITRLRFRVVDLTTYQAPSGVADLRLLSSPGSLSVAIDGAPCGSETSIVTVRGTTLEEPPFQPNGGGYNSTLTISASSTSFSIPNNSTFAVHFRLGVEQPGVARFCVVPEVLPDAVGEPFCYIGNTEVGTVYTPGDFDNDQIADATLYESGFGLWSVLRSSGGFTSGALVSLGGPGAMPVPGDYDGDNRLDVAVYRPATGEWTVRTSSSDFTRGFSLNLGGPAYTAVPGDYDGDRQTDVAVYHPPSGRWEIVLSSVDFAGTVIRSWGGSAYTPIGGLDFDGDGKADLTLYNETLGTWYVLLSGVNFTTAISKSWGGAGYTLVPGDYDGDGKADYAVYNRNTGVWSALRSSTGYTSSLTVSYGGPGYIPIPADYDGDGRIDVAVYRPQTNAFVALTSSSAYALGSAIVRTFGLGREVPVTSAVLPHATRELDAGDFDGDFASDMTVYNTTSGTWSILRSSSGFASGTNIGWGGTGYTAAPGDYDGDGRLDLGVYHGSTGTWLVLLSASNYTTTLVRSSGGAGWEPVPGDYDGDGKTDLVVYNTTTGQWFGLKSSTSYTTTVNASWGGTGYTAAPGDFDGDGRQDLAVYQASTGTWAMLTSSSNYTASITRNLGGAADVPVQADYDGDGITDFAIYHPSTGLWTMLRSATGHMFWYTVSHGGAGATPVAGDWDGDGRADVGVYTTAGSWTILLSSRNYMTPMARSWGGPGSVPLPRFQ